MRTPVRSGAERRRAGESPGIARGLNGSLSIGITSSDAFHPKIFALIRQFQVQNMAVQVHGGSQYVVADDDAGGG